MRQSLGSGLPTTVTSGCEEEGLVLSWRREGITVERPLSGKGSPAANDKHLPAVACEPFFKRCMAFCRGASIDWVLLADWLARAPMLAWLALTRSVGPLTSSDDSHIVEYKLQPRPILRAAS